MLTRMLFRRHLSEEEAQSGRDEKQNSEPKESDVSSNSFFLNLFATYIASLSSSAYSEEKVEEILSSLRDCNSTGKLCKTILQAISSFPFVESALRFLQLSRMGLRENELYRLLQITASVNGEDLNFVLELLRPLTVKTLGNNHRKPNNLWTHRLRTPQ